MTQPTKGPSIRVLRMGEAVRHALAEILARGDVHDDLLAAHLVSVTEVRMTPDLRHATAFIKPLLGQQEAEVLKALRSHTAYLQRAIAAKVNARYAAKLRFVIDGSFEEGSHIDQLLASPRVARDLVADVNPREEDEGGRGAPDGLIPRDRKPL